MSNESQREHWSVWGGDKNCPYTGMVEVKFRDGDTERGESTCFRWGHTDSPGDIIAWRPALCSVDSEKVETALNTQIGGEHYKKYTIQPVEFITKNKLGFLEGCVIKRICRYEDKNGREDLEKIKHEIDLLIELKYGSQA